ncbi:MAG: ROK family transcriptional regulator [Halanaerobiaceae bacterium]
MEQRGSFKLMKKLNRRIILKLIQKKEGISRSELAEITDLSPAAVTNIVNDLLDKEFIREARVGKSSGGRKPILLEINPEGAYVIGLEWGISGLRGVILNLDHEIISSEELVGEEYSIDYYIRNSVDLISRLTAKIDNPKKIFGVGIGIHGLVDPQKGYSLFAPHFNWEKLPVKELLAEEISYPLLLDNDVRMMAQSEIWQGRKNFVFINTGSGIGAAIVWGGELLYGKDFSAGEFGHMKIVEDGPLCSCGNYGCLEALISIKKIVTRYYGKEEEPGSHSRLKEKWFEIIARAKRGEKKAENIIEESSHYLGTGIANLVNLLNPEAIVINGPLMAAEEKMLPVIQQEAGKKALNITGSNINIQVARFGARSGAVGAGFMVLKKLFNLEEGGDE